MVTVADPDDLGQVTAACGEIAAAAAARWPGCEPEVIANYTGGTKTMSLGLGLYALHRSGGRWSLQLNRLAAGGRTDLVGIRAGDEPVRQDASRALAETAAEWAGRLEARHDGEGAAELISRALAGLPLAADEQRRLLHHRLRCRFLAARDRLDFRRALELAEQDPELAEVHGPRLRKLVRIAAALAEEGPWPGPSLQGLELVDELRDGAARLAERGDHRGALARLVRAAATLAELRLRRLHGVDPRALGPADRRLPASVRNRLEASPLGPEGSGVWQAYRLLEKLGDPLGRHFRTTEEQLAELLARSGTSPFSTGLEPIDRHRWRYLAKRWREWLDAAQEIL